MFKKGYLCWGTGSLQFCSFALGGWHWGVHAHSGQQHCFPKEELTRDCLWHGPSSPSELWMGSIPQVFTQAYCQMLPPCGETVWADVRVPHRFVSSKCRALSIQSTHGSLVQASGRGESGGDLCTVLFLPLSFVSNPCPGLFHTVLEIHVFLKLFSLNMVSFTVLLQSYVHRTFLVLSHILLNVLPSSVEKGFIEHRFFLQYYFLKLSIWHFAWASTRTFEITLIYMKQDFVERWILHRLVF